MPAGASDAYLDGTAFGHQLGDVVGEGSILLGRVAPTEVAGKGSDLDQGFIAEKGYPLLALVSRHERQVSQ